LDLTVEAKLRWIRSLSAIIAVVALAFIYSATLQLTGSLNASMFAMAVPAFTPMFATTAGIANHDVLIFALGACAAYFFIRALYSRQKRFQLLTLLMFSLMSLSKSTGVPLLLGFTLYFGAANALKGRLDYKYCLAVFLLWVPVVGWHGYMALQHGLLLVPYRDQNVLSADKVSFAKFLREVPVIETVVSTFSGFIWVVRDQSVSAVTSFPSGRLLFFYMASIIALLGSAAWGMLSGKRWHAAGNVPLTLGSFACCGAVSLFLGLYVSHQTILSSLIVALISFLCVSAMIRAYKLIPENSPSLEFSILAFSAMMCSLILVMQAFYSIYLDRGRSGALHGRYVYMIAPVFLVALVSEISSIRYSKYIFMLLLVLFIAFDSVYWVRFSLPIYNAIDTF